MNRTIRFELRAVEPCATRRPFLGGEASFALAMEWNGGYCADSSRSRGDVRRRASRPTDASKAAVCYVRSTSIRDVASNSSNPPNSCPTTA